MSAHAAGSGETGATMSIAQSAAEILRNHTTLEMECIDRMYLNAYVPPLQRELGIVGFFKYHRRQLIPSSVLMGKLTEGFVKSINQFVKGGAVPVVRFSAIQLSICLAVMVASLLTMRAPPDNRA